MAFLDLHEGILEEFAEADSRQKADRTWEIARWLTIRNIKSKRDPVAARISARRYRRAISAQASEALTVRLNELIESHVLCIECGADITHKLTRRNVPGDKRRKGGLEFCGSKCRDRRAYKDLCEEIEQRNRRANRRAA